jgi:hypothetical protein
MTKVIVPPGTRFGQWVVLSNEGSDRDGKVLVRCQCDCGTEIVMQSKTLRTGMTKKCRQCYIRGIGYLDACPDRRVRRSLTSRIRAIANRCLNPSNKCYKNYGARGIKIHAAWVSDKVAFLKYLLTLPGHDDPKLTIDRINNDGHYEPGNIRFATRSVQTLNQRKPNRRKPQPERTGVRCQ